VCRNAKVRKLAKDTDYYKRRHEKSKGYKREYYKRPEVLDRMRNKWFQKSYGITIQEYYEILKKQDEKCAICETKAGNEKNKRLVVDHHHETNIVRGLLCQRCNRAIGLLRDDRALLEKAIMYLGKFSDFGKKRRSR
jgi:hypothetical protein